MNTLSLSTHPSAQTVHTPYSIQYTQAQSNIMKSKLSSFLPLVYHRLYDETGMYETHDMYERYASSLRRGYSVERLEKLAYRKVTDLNSWETSREHLGGVLRGCK